MESTILCMLTSALCLFTWAIGSMAAVGNVTQPTVSMPKSNGATTNMSSSSVTPTHSIAFDFTTEVGNVTQPTVGMPKSNEATTKISSSSVTPPHFIRISYDIEVQICWLEFNVSMSDIPHGLWCNWKYIIGPYSELQSCLEGTAEASFIPFPNQLAHNTILNVHMHYFKNCSLLSEELRDPPENILLGLIFAPICIIPFLVTLVVYKSNTSRPQT